MKYLGHVYARPALRAAAMLPIVATVAYMVLRLAELVQMVRG